MFVTFSGNHSEDSPWYEHWCNGPGRQELIDLGAPAAWVEETTCADGISSTFGTSFELQSPEGVIEISPEEGEFPPNGPDSDPQLDGFRLCTLVIRVTDGGIATSSSRQQIELDCDED
jgi:hypothetical protein